MPRRLVANGNHSSSAWSTGAARYREGIEVPQGKLVVAVRCRFDGDHRAINALLDTGAEWSVFGGKIATRARRHALALGMSISMQTRRGRIHGEFHRTLVTLLADDGADCQVPATVLLAPEWEGPAVLGYRGFLERLRFALDPGVAANDQWMHFGAVG
jgi:hypothetical protein